MAGTVVIIQCGAKKLDTVARAEDLYTGPLFRACRQAARRVGDRWYIASAKYGLVRPERVLAPYNQTLGINETAWGATMRRDIGLAEPEHWDRLIALCSRRYLIGWAEFLGAETPLAGLTIGYAIQAAKRFK